MVGRTKWIRYSYIIFSINGTHIFYDTVPVVTYLVSSSERSTSLRFSSVFFFMETLW
jgi:hypothetical protein